MLALSAQCATADTVLPDIFAFVYVQAETVGGLGFDQKYSPPEDLPLLATAAAGGNSVYPGTTATAAAGITGGLDPSLLVSASGRGGSSGTIPVTGDATAIAHLSYSIEITGPDTLPISVLFQGSNSMAQDITSTDGGHVSTSAEITIKDPDGNIVENQGGGDFSTSLMFTPGLIYTVVMEATVGVEGHDSLVEGAASIDPTFTIDPSLTGYSILYSPGLVSTSATPLPGTWLMMVSGLGLLGFVGYRRARSRHNFLLAA